MKAEDQTRKEIDRLLAVAGWLVHGLGKASLQAARSVALRKSPLESGYVTDGAHRSIYTLRRQVQEYFDACVIGLTATLNKQTFGFFNHSLVMAYGPHWQLRQAVADSVHLDCDTAYKWVKYV